MYSTRYARMLQSLKLFVLGILCVKAHVIGTYYPSWTIYEERGRPQHFIELFALTTHLTYAFASLGRNGTVELVDPWADVEYRSNHRSLRKLKLDWDGNFKQLKYLKTRLPDLKMGLSIGGWGRAPVLSEALSTPKGISTAVESILFTLRKYGFDYVDIDWEFPNSELDGENLSKFLVQLSKALKDPSNSKMYQITMACPGHLQELLKENPAHWPPMDLVSETVDYIFLMSYDYGSPFQRDSTCHCSPLHGLNSVEHSVVSLQALGIPPGKIVLGIPLYGYIFEGSTNLGDQFLKSGKLNGPVRYRDLVAAYNESDSYWDAVSQASYIKDSETSLFISYESVRSVEAKTEFVWDHNLGGVFFWEVSGDVLPDNPMSLIRAAYQRL